MQVGEYEILPVLDGQGRIRPTAFRGTTEETWAPHRDLLDADGMLPMAVGGFLIRGGPEGRNVLVDAGMGDRDFMGGRNPALLLRSLAAYGVQPADVTDLVFSHLHLDHVGWASKDGAVVFANATYRCDQRDWDYWVTSPSESLTGVSPAFVAAQKEVLEPVADRLKGWSVDGPLLPGIDALHAPGHTPGSAILVVSSGAERAMLLGDVVHCPVELLDDEWAGLGDVDPALAKRTRNALARELEGKDIPVSAAHFAGMSFGRLIAAEGKRRWVL